MKTDIFRRQNSIFVLGHSGILMAASAPSLSPIFFRQARPLRQYVERNRSATFWKRCTRKCDGPQRSLLLVFFLMFTIPSEKTYVHSLQKVFQHFEKIVYLLDTKISGESIPLIYLNLPVVMTYFLKGKQRNKSRRQG